MKYSKEQVWEFITEADDNILCEAMRIWYGDLSPIFSVFEESVDSCPESWNDFQEEIERVFGKQIEAWLKSKKEIDKSNNRYLVINGEKVFAKEGQTPAELMKEWGTSHGFYRVVITRISKKHGEKPITSLKQIRWKGTYQVLKEVV